MANDGLSERRESMAHSLYLCSYTYLYIRAHTHVHIHVHITDREENMPPSPLQPSFF